MPLTSTKTTAINATYDRWAIEFRTAGDGLLPYGSEVMPQPPIRAMARLTKFRVRPDGVSERSPLPADSITLVIDDLYAAAATRPSIATAMAALIAAVGEVAASEGKL